MVKILNVRYWFNIYLKYVFFRALQRELQLLSIPIVFDKLKGEIFHEMRGIYTQNKSRIKNKTDLFNMEWVILVLAAYRVLQPVVSTPEMATNIVGTSFAFPFRKISKIALIVRYGIIPLRPRTAFSIISKKFKSKGERFFGQSFIYEQENLNNDQSFINIRKCFFFDFFQANEAPQLTRLFCHVDRVFVDELNKPKYELRFERPTAMGYGDDICRFQFTRKTIDRVGDEP